MGPLNNQTVDLFLLYFTFLGGMCSTCFIGLLGFFFLLQEIEQMSERLLFIKHIDRLLKTHVICVLTFQIKMH